MITTFSDVCCGDLFQEVDKETGEVNENFTFLAIELHENTYFNSVIYEDKQVESDNARGYGAKFFPYDKVKIINRINNK